MSDISNIEWTDSTFNPWEGCTKVGAGCDHCYAEVRNARYAGGQSINWGAGAPRRRTSNANWNKPVKWNKEADAFFAEHGRRQRVFCASLADVFDNEVDPAWRADLFHLIEETPNLDWLLLTKRIGNASKMIRDARLALVGSTRLIFPEVLQNVWLGATVVNQMEADRDIPKLLEIPASVRFLSIEPLLDSIDLKFHFFEPTGNWRTYKGKRQMELTEHKKLHWVIVGGESGSNARPMHPEWARSLRDQCTCAGVPFLFKQWGEYAPSKYSALPSISSSDGNIELDVAWPDGTICNGNAEDHGGKGILLTKYGKKAAGRLLDGVTHDDYPEAAV